MVSLIRSKARSVVSSMAACGSSSTHLNPFPLSRFSALPNPFFGFPRIWVASNQTRLDEVKDTQTGVEEEFTSFKEQQNVPKSGAGMSMFDELKQRFLSFKKHKYLKEWEHFRTLAEAQSPKFMVIGCVDSRVCPSNILGFQPGEAFMVRNVANLVPPLESGPSETNAALEFAVNTLEVENILIIGHSSCAGIQALMNLQDDEESSFVKSWVSKGKVAKLRTQAEANHLNFDEQCRYCEKESINRSLLNLLTYPWIKDRVRKDLLFVHGGYYDFLNCTFEKWTLDLEGNNIEEKGSYSVKDHEIWC